MKELADNPNTITKKIHLLTSGAKIICSEHAEESSRVASVLCGGHGYSMINEMAAKHNDLFIYQTFEGDNCVLRQEICKEVLSKHFKKYGFDLPCLDCADDLSLATLVQIVKKYKLLLTNVVLRKIGVVAGGTSVEQFDAWNSSLLLITRLADISIYNKLLTIMMKYHAGDANVKMNDMIRLFVLDIMVRYLDQLLLLNIISVDVGNELSALFESECIKLKNNNIHREIIMHFAIPNVFMQIPLINKKHLLSAL
jgi:hypothetical protein